MVTVESRLDKLRDFVEDLLLACAGSEDSVEREEVALRSSTSTRLWAVSFGLEDGETLVIAEHVDDGVRRLGRESVPREEGAHAGKDADVAAKLLDHVVEFAALRLTLEDLLFEGRDAFLGPRQALAGLLLLLLHAVPESIHLAVLASELGDR